MSYQARQGDIVWVSLDPQSGHEQKGRRPALIVSNNTFNNFTRYAAMLCPITNTIRNNPLQISLDKRTTTKGVIMCDQAKILDIVLRNAEFIESVPPDIVAEAANIISGFVSIDG
jgi:mRNA interferase MazF